MSTTVEERPPVDVEAQPKKDNPNAPHDDDDTSDEEVDTRVPFRERAVKYMKRVRKQTKYAIFHRTKGRSYFCFNTCGFWCSQLFFLLFLYVFVVGCFIAYMSIGSEMMPFTFITYKTRDPSTIPAPIPARDYFGTQNSTNNSTSTTTKALSYILGLN
ncbi:hypothetical protein FDP41_000236 [Naegleria fowleri]|uniref:Uncharacterized protein n=1 Tax=Naegleria fowleri TaxID=5763 RepID=A0A6A5C7C2_NAEFO|nr:uncharacterized protein FDP41_000236 [Naegleria fowleri]KAF0985197.1 hypothetical protein FDP41_000236 [Naegleria fowleri]CAG4714259.1 unnamed protein product [Naegleria fowleri]